MFVPYRRVFSLAIVAASLTLVGCNKEPQVSSYEVPKSDGPGAATTQAADPPQSNDAATDAAETRMLAAVVLRESEAWFFKLTGLSEQVAKVADDVVAFVESVDLPEDDPNAVNWKVPEGWNEGSARPMREATLVLPQGEPPLSLAISKLGYDGNQEPYLLMNVNRWRGQLGLDDVKSLDEAAGVQTLTLDGGTAWLLDATGTMASGGPMGMRPPFAGGASAPPAQAPAAPPAAQARPTIVLNPPDSWKTLPRGTMGSRGFMLGEGETAATLKVSDFPPVGVMSDPLENFNRWRGEVGLSRLTPETLDENTTKIDIASEQAVMATMVSEDGQRATHAAMVTKLGKVWFFKLTGSEAAVDAHRNEVVDWLGTVRIEPAGGAE